MHERESSHLGYLAGNWPPDPNLPTLVFIHGAGSSSVHWTVQLEALLDVANTVAVDLPGHGRSPGPGMDTVAGYTRALVDFVDELGLPRPVLAGFSMGGAIAQQALLDCPGKFPAAVLIPVSKYAGNSRLTAGSSVTDFSDSPSIGIRDIQLDKVKRSIGRINAVFP